MTDAPRFQRLNFRAEDAYRSHHGAGIVAFAFSCADRWMAWRERRTLTRANAPNKPNAAPGVFGSAKVGNALTQRSASSSRQSRAGLLSAVPIALAMSASVPANVDAWAVLDAPAIEKSQFGFPLRSLDATHPASFTSSQCLSGHGPRPIGSMRAELRLRYCHVMVQR